jgi:hypothetical protein
MAGCIRFLGKKMSWREVGEWLIFQLKAMKRSQRTLFSGDGEGNVSSSSQFKGLAAMPGLICRIRYRIRQRNGSWPYGSTLRFENSEVGNLPPLSTAEANKRRKSHFRFPLSDFRHPLSVNFML